MRVLVCGGRHFSGLGFAFNVLDGIHKMEPITLIIHGGMTGADSIADEWARRNEIPCLRVPAEWKKHEALGRRNAAGPIRNGEMLKKGKPQLVVAFPGHTGTADMVAKARAANVPVREESPG